MSEARVEKLTHLFKQLGANDEGLEDLEQALAEAGFGLTRLVGKIPFPQVDDPARLAAARQGVFMDTETTGVDHKKDKVIQLAMRKFLFDDQGILSVGDAFDRFNDPGQPIAEVITNLTGITDDDVRGHKIETSDITDFLGETELVVCHHSRFDRKMMEANFPDAGFEDMSFDCTMEQIDWKKRGFSSPKLELLAAGFRLSYDAHNALNDIDVLPFILEEANADGVSAFAEMRANAPLGATMIIARGAPIENKDLLKERGYRWCTGETDEAFGYKAWWRELPSDPELLAEEAIFLQEEVFREPAQLPAFAFDPKNRYSARRPDAEITFRTQEPKSIIDALKQRAVAQGGQASMDFSPR